MEDKPKRIRARCIKVPKVHAEAARRKLLAEGVLRQDLQPARDENFIYFPVLRGELAGECPAGERDFLPSRRVPASYREIVEVPAGLRKLLPRAFDVIGKVIVVKVPEELLDWRREIGRALLAARPEARSVAMDRGIKGEGRIRQLEVIAGEPSLETVHVEHGARFLLDPSKVYFSPRLATERLRVAGLVAGGERVLDMFAGVGPFAIHIARRARPSVVHASDINPAAIEYLKRNLELNKVDRVETILGDARKLPCRIEVVDRIIMNLPHSAFDFLPVALEMLRPGGTIHLYEILVPEKLAKRKEALGKAVEAAGRRMARSNPRLVRGYSTLESHFAFDLLVD